MWSACSTDLEQSLQDVKGHAVLDQVQNPLLQGSQAPSITRQLGPHIWGVPLHTLQHLHALRCTCAALQKPHQASWLPCMYALTQSSRAVLGKPEVTCCMHSSSCMRCICVALQKCHQAVWFPCTHADTQCCTFEQTQPGH